MIYSRRKVLGLGSAALAGLAFAPTTALKAFAQDALTGDTLPGTAGDITVHPVNHASLALSGGGKIIYADPVGDGDRYSDLPKPDLILITHEHGDHYNPGTVGGLIGDNTKIIANPAVHGMLPAELKAISTSLGNGDSGEVAGVSVDAIPAYNMTEDRKKFHPEGRDNGYILTLDGVRIYIAGDTEDIPEMRTLTDIGLAFIPMNLPFTMDIEQAASAVIEFAPKVIYPYHYGESDVAKFKTMVAAENSAVEVRLGDWY